MPQHKVCQVHGISIPEMHPNDGKNGVIEAKSFISIQNEKRGDLSICSFLLVFFFFNTNYSGQERLPDMFVIKKFCPSALTLQKPRQTQLSSDSG